MFNEYKHSRNYDKTNNTNASKERVQPEREERSVQTPKSLTLSKRKNNKSTQKMNTLIDLFASCFREP